MKISYSKYELEAKHTIQHRTVHIKRHGALLRVAYNEYLVGYADCHPWEVLGDLPLDKQLSLLAEGNVTCVSARSLYFARLDAHARYRKENLLAKLAIPKSHYLVTNIRDVDEVAATIEEGFTHFKIKLGLQLKNESEFLQKIIDAFPDPSYKVRLDFNLKLNQNEFIEFIGGFKDKLSFIDFCEDPFCYNESSWREVQSKCGVPFACDENMEEVVRTGSPEIVIFKPAIQSQDMFRDQKHRIIVTTYLGHPMSQLAAAYTASTLNLQNEICGILSHRVYEMNPFSEQLSMKGPEFVVPQGTGFGYDDILAKLPWTNLH